MRCLSALTILLMIPASSLYAQQHHPGAVRPGGGMGAIRPGGGMPHAGGGGMGGSFEHEMMRQQMVFEQMMGGGSRRGSASAPKGGNSTPANKSASKASTPNGNAAQANKAASKTQNGTPAAKADKSAESSASRAENKSLTDRQQHRRELTNKIQEKRRIETKLVANVRSLSTLKTVHTRIAFHPHLHAAANHLDQAIRELGGQTSTSGLARTIDPQMIRESIAQLRLIEPHEQNHAVRANIGMAIAELAHQLPD